MIQTLKPSSRKVVIVFASFIILLGVYLRFSNLDLKLFWHDEAISATRIVGILDSEVYSFFENNNSKITSISEFSKLHERQPNKNILDTLKTGFEDSHVTPLYYLIGHIWVSVFGDSITAIRSLSAVLGAGAIGAMLWCSSVLFQSSQAGFMAAALLASSPFMVLYSQEARMYSLWTLTILLCHGCFIRAIQTSTRRSWLLYAVSATVSIYSHLFTLFVIFSHSAYIFLAYIWPKVKSQSREILARFSLSIVLTLVCSTPWIVVVFTNVSDVKERSAWLDNPIQMSQVIHTFLSSIANTIVLSSSYRVPFWEGYDISSSDRIIIVFIFLIFFAVVGTLLKSPFASQRTDSQGCYEDSNLLILCLILTPVLTFVLPSALLEKTVGSIVRYYFPIILSLQIGLTFCLFYKWTSFSRKGCLSLWALLCVVSLTSSSQTVSEKTNWSKGYDAPLWDAIASIKEIQQPVIFTTSAQGVNLLTLSYYLDPETQLLVAPSLDDVDVSSIQNQVESGREVLVFLNTQEEERKLADMTGYDMQALQEKGDVLLSRLVAP